MESLQSESNPQPFEGWPLFRPFYEKLTKIEHDLQSFQARAEAAEGRLEADPRPLVFFHLAKTGGSSIWQTLAELAASSSPPVPLIDLYHHSRYDHHTVTSIDRVLVQFKPVLQGRRILIHHHTSDPIGFFFELNPVYTTIVRDPLDRFISEINHCRAQLRGDLDPLHQAGLIDPKVEMEGRGWSRELIEKATTEGLGFEALVEYALGQPGMTDYYFRNFHHLLHGTPGSSCPSANEPNRPSNRALALAVRARFAHIGRFPDVYEAGAEIARIYKLPETFSKETFPHTLQRNSRQLMRDLRPRLKPPFQSDYAFLAELGFNFPEDA